MKGFVGHFPPDNQGEMSENGLVVRACHLLLGDTDMSTATLDANNYKNIIVLYDFNKCCTAHSELLKCESMKHGISSSKFKPCFDID